MNVLSIQGEPVIRGKLLIQTATWEDFTIQMVKPATANESAEFKPGRVLKNNVEWWMFQKDHPGYRGTGKLVEHNDELLICLINKGDLDQVLPIRDLPNFQKTKDEEFIGGRGLKELMKLKEAIAVELGLEPVWSEREARMRQAVRDVGKSERDAKEAAAKKAKATAEEERKRVREEERAKILSRKRQYAFTATGDRRNGIPIVGDEWEKLPSDTFCIQVESWDDETSEAGAFIESFIVSKKGTKKVRVAVIAVTRDNPQRPLAATKPLEVEPIIVTIKGEPEEVIPVDNMEAVRALNERKLNSGTLVMCPKAGDEKRFSVFRLIGGKIEAVTELVRKST